MGCVNSVQKLVGEGAANQSGENNGDRGSRRLSVWTTFRSPPSAVSVQEGVLAEIIRYRRRSIHSTSDLETVQSEEIALMVMLQSLEENTEISEPEQDCIVDALRNNVLFSCMQPEQLKSLAKFMFIQVVEPGQRVVTHGEIGDKFFVVRSGKFDVISVDGQVMNRLTAGSTFGELGLLFSAKRTANVIADAKVRGSLYALHGKYFRYVAAQHSIGTFHKSLEALKKVKLLEQLTEDQLRTVANSVQALQFRAGDVIVHKGDPGSMMYMIYSGTVVCTDIGRGAGAASVELNEGEYFGERALLASEPRAATVVAKTDVRVMALDQKTFTSVLGPLHVVLNYNRMFRTLESVAVLKTVPFALKKKLMDSAQMVQYEQDQVIVQEGDEGDSLFIIKDGEAKVMQHQTAKSSMEQQPEVPANDLEVARIGPGDTFGEMALLNSAKRVATVVACTKVECFRISQSDFDEILGGVRQEFEELANVRSVINQDKTFAHALSIDSLERMRVVGVGSYGIVYIAQHKPTGRFVAVKEMWKARLEHGRQVHHIRTEKSLLQMMGSPFLLKFYAALQDEQKVYFVTELLLGGELFHRIVGPTGHPVALPQSDARFYIACCVKALEYLHERNIVYRDLKPENILLDAIGYVKLVDFGFAKKLVGKTFTLCGTPEYLAPEVILGSGHGLSVDSWGLGVLLYEMVMGDSPFSTKDEDHLSICHNILQDKIYFPENCDPVWKAMVLRLLHRQPEQRASMITGTANAIHQDPWFQDFDWHALAGKQLLAPWTPDLKSDSDARYFQSITSEELAGFDSWTDVPPAWSWEKF